MPLFEYDEGHLIPAQFGRTVVDGLTDDILKSVREQVLEIVGRPLFPITWQDSGPIGTQTSTPRLTALDASGQVVSVEVLERLDSQAMIDSLSRLADTASLGWNDLAAAYPGGMQGFRNGWTEFRDSMPPSPAPGPRLVLVAGTITDSVRPALDVLASSGVEVHEIVVRAMSNGRKFIDVQAVGPRLYGHNPNLLLGHSINTLELESTNTDEITAPQNQRSYDPWDDETNETNANTEPEGAEPADEATQPHDEPAHEQHEQATEPETLDSHEEPSAEPQVPQLSKNAEALEVIAGIIGEPTPLIWSGPGKAYQATLAETGVMYTNVWSTKDPNEAAAMVTGSSEHDGWEHWHLADLKGPSLLESLNEINREIRNEYENLGQPKRGRRSR